MPASGISSALIERGCEHVPLHGLAICRLCHFAALGKHPPCRRTRFAYHEGLQNLKANGSKTPMGKIVQARCDVIGLAFILALISTASAQDAEKAFFAGKTVRMVVGSATGGGYDIYSRLIAPYLARVLNATVIVENQPGAGGLISLNRLYVTEPDGLTLTLANGTSAAFAQLTDQQ